MSVCCQVQVSATGRSLVQKGPSEGSVSECDGDTSTAPVGHGALGLLRHGERMHMTSRFEAKCERNETEVI